MKKFKVIMDKCRRESPIMLEALCNQFLGWLQIIFFRQSLIEFSNFEKIEFRVMKPFGEPLTKPISILLWPNTFNFSILNLPCTCLPKLFLSNLRLKLLSLICQNDGIVLDSGI